MNGKTCPNCAAAMRNDDHFCSQCGQEAIGDESVRGFLLQFLGDYFTFDSKIARSLLPLLVRPGFLTAEYLEGRRARYIPPLRMFIFLSVFFFLLIGSASATAHAVDEDLAERVFWDSFFGNILPKLFFLFLPVFALLVHLLYRDKPARFAKPFVLSAHFHAFVFLAFTLYGLLSRLLAGLGLVQVNQMLVIALLGYTMAYLWVSLRRVYPRSLAGQILRYVALLSLYAMLLASSAIVAAWLLR